MTIGKALKGGVLGRNEELLLGGVKGWARAFTYDFLDDVAQLVCVKDACYWETPIKYLVGALAPEIYNTAPEAVGMEVNLIKEVREVFMPAVPYTDWLSPGDKGLFLVQQTGTAFDVLAADRPGRLVLVEIKRIDGVSLDKLLGDKEQLPQFYKKIEALQNLDEVFKRTTLSAGEALSCLIAAYNGAGPTGVVRTPASSTFTYAPSLPKIEWRGRETPVVLSLVLVDAEEKKAVVYAVEAKLGDITWDFLKSFASDAYNKFEAVPISGGVELQKVVQMSVESFSGTPPFLK